MKRLILIMFVVVSTADSIAQMVILNNQSNILYEDVELKENIGFYVDLGGIIIAVPSASVQEQCQFIAWRSVNSPYSNDFDQDFFQKAIEILEERYETSELFMLKLWGSYFVEGGRLVKIEDYNKFLRQSIDYRLFLSTYLEDGKYYLKIDKVRLEIIKKTTKKVEVPEGFYYIRKQSLY